MTHMKPDNEPPSRLDDESSRREPPLFVAAAAVAVAVLIAGCGSSSSSPAKFRAEQAAICRSTYTQFVAALTISGPVLKRVQATASALNTLTNRMSALNPPSADAAAYHKFMRLLKTADAAYKKLVSVARTGNLTKVYSLLFNRRPAPKKLASVARTRNLTKLYSLFNGRLARQIIPLLNYAGPSGTGIKCIPPLAPFQIILS
jgi:hypothetical protein